MNRIDYEVIKDAFPEKAWAYVVMYHGVEIGCWDREKLDFYPEAFDESCCLELRVFDENRELRFLRRPDQSFAFRDTNDYADDKEAGSRDVRYVMYGEKPPQFEEGRTILKEDRGGKLYFPRKLDMSDPIVLKIGVKNYYRYNDVPVGKNAGADGSEVQSCFGALEYYDDRLTGFYVGADETEVTL